MCANTTRDTPLPGKHGLREKDNQRPVVQVRVSEGFVSIADRTGIDGTGTVSYNSDSKQQILPSFSR